MSSSGAGEDRVQNHGVALTQGINRRVRCNYCSKEVAGFNRLQHHLGHVGHDVTHCPQAPIDVKERMGSALLERRKGKLLKQVEKVLHPQLPLKRNFTPATSTQPSTSAAALLITTDSDVNDCPVYPLQPTSVLQNTVSSESGDMGASSNNEDQNEGPESLAAKCIGRYFYEAGTMGLASIQLTSFHEMINAVISCGAGYKPPTYDELMGCLLHEEVLQVKKRIKNIKRSWQRTGCSILFDSWTDQKGSILVRFLVDCPQGAIFLKSVDVSDVVYDVDALFLLFSGVLEEVGPWNVVQIMAPETPSYMEDVIAMLLDKYKTIFWTPCADDCMNMILEEIGTDKNVEDVLTQAKAITRFIYGHKQTLELMNEHIKGGGLVKSSHLKSVAQFITLHNMVSQRDNLMLMFSSHTWNESILSSQIPGKTTSDLVKDSSFWAAAEGVLKITDPLVDVLHKINGGTEAPMGVLYGSMNLAKVKIKENFDHVKQKYMPYWVMIDEIWNNNLHNHLHSAGYYFNPKLFYSDGFYVDKKVTDGILYCIARMVEDQNAQELIIQQLDIYRGFKAGLSDPMAIAETTTASPALWWSRYAERIPELQSFAVKILSQPCTSVSRYRLSKDLSEQLHVEGRKCIEQKRLRALELVYNNLNLWNSSSKMNCWDNTSLEDIDPLNDWIVEI